MKKIAILGSQDEVSEHWKLSQDKYVIWRLQHLQGNNIDLLKQIRNSMKLAAV